MNNPQYINTVIFVGAPPSTPLSQLIPGSSGVNFTAINPTIIIPFAPGITPIIASISVPNTNTNVNAIIVLITAPDSTVLVNQVSPIGTNKVVQFPVEALPENSIVVITFQTKDGKPPQNVTISIMACYTPPLDTTSVTSGSISPIFTGSTSSLIISSTASGATQGTGEQAFHFMCSSENGKYFH